jgi:hypothetical protein
MNDQFEPEVDEDDDYDWENHSIDCPVCGTMIDEREADLMDGIEMCEDCAKMFKGDNDKFAA